MQICQLVFSLGGAVQRAFGQGAKFDLPTQRCLPSLLPPTPLCTNSGIFPIVLPTFYKNKELLPHLMTETALFCSIRNFSSQNQWVKPTARPSMRTSSSS